MRREYGTGSITFDKSVGKFSARITINGKKIKKTFSTKKAASCWLSEMNNQQDFSAYSVGEWLLKYIVDYKEPFLRSRSLERVKQAALKLESLYNIPLHQLTPDDIQICLNSMNLSVSSIKKSRDLLKAALNQAQAQGLITKNPAIATKMQKQEKKKIEIFTRRELGKIFHALRKLQKNKFNNSQRYDMILFFRLLLFTGTRISELLALRWENVHDDYIEITNSKDIDTQVLNDTKTAAGHREIEYLSEKTKLMLFQCRKTHGFVFENKNRGAMNYQRVFLTWNNVRKLTKITKTIHTFRHTCISYLLMHNYDIAFVSSFAGHSNPAITLEVYTHLIRKHRTLLGHIKSNSTE